MVKVDIKDFYVVGEHHLIAENVANLFNSDPRLQSIVFDVAYFLLDNQYVRSLKKLHKVRCGAGIGLLHAGDIADACFYSMVEQKLLEDHQYEAAGVIDWFRFRDDMCFFLSSGPLFKRLLERMSQLATFYELKVEDVSTVELRYLDLVFRRQDGRIAVCPYLKDPCLSRRLSRLSAHPWEIHQSWPKMLFKRAELLTNSSEALCEYKSVLTSRLRNDGCLVPSGMERHRGLSALNCRESKMFWLPLGFHPWWYRQVRKALTRMNSNSSLTCLLPMAVKAWKHPRVRLAWKNMLPNTQILLQN